MRRPVQTKILRFHGLSNMINCFNDYYDDCCINDGDDDDDDAIDDLPEQGWQVQS